MDFTRRSWLAAALASPPPANDRDWFRLAETFPVDRRVINFNHAGVGTCPAAVTDAVVRRTREGEQAAPDTIFSYAPRLEPVRRGLAAMLACDAEEVAITRNATESLNAVLLGIPLRAGDEVLTTTLDYWAMLDALEQRAARDGVVVRKLRIPTPCDDLARITEIFERAFTPRTKLILISHPINLNGQMMPVRALSDLAHSRGAEVVVDAAQSFALTGYKIADLGCDYLGTSLHKWLQAPKGTGLLYVRRDKIEKTWPLFAAGSTRRRDDIRKFELYGTWPETILALEDALAFHQSLGGAAKEARHRELTRRWINATKGVKGLRFHTPLEPHASCGITCVELEGIATPALRQWLRQERRIVTMDVTRRTEEFAGVRISPGLSNTPAEIDALVAALVEARAAM